MSLNKISSMVKASTNNFVATINAPSQTSAADAFCICGKALGIYAFEMVVLFPLSVVLWIGGR